MREDKPINESYTELVNIMNALPPEVLAHLPSDVLKDLQNLAPEEFAARMAVAPLLKM